MFYFLSMFMVRSTVKTDQPVKKEKKVRKNDMEIKSSVSSQVAVKKTKKTSDTQQKVVWKTSKKASFSDSDKEKLKKINISKKNIEKDWNDSPKWAVKKTKSQTVQPAETVSSKTIPLKKNTRKKSKIAIVDTAFEPVDLLKKTSKKTVKNTKIPVWIWIFFWCSLWIFLFSFYKAILLPKIIGDAESVWKVVDLSLLTHFSWQEKVSEGTGFVENTKISSVESVKTKETWKKSKDDSEKNSKKFLLDFYSLLSEKKIDDFLLLIPVKIQRQLFWNQNLLKTFISNIDGQKLEPKNIEVSLTDNGALFYTYSLQYSLYNQTYNEDWEMLVKDDVLLSLKCVSKWCVYHPIFDIKKCR